MSGETTLGRIVDWQGDHVPIVVVGFRNVDDILACLDSLDHLATEPPTSVLICENGGADASARLVEALGRRGGLAQVDETEGFEEFVKLTRLRLPNSGREVLVGEAAENLGYAGGINIWLRPLLRTPGWQGVWILNPDSTAEPPALAEMIATAQARHLAMTGSQVLYERDANEVHCRGLRWRKLLSKTLAVDLAAPVDEKPDLDKLEAGLDSPVGSSFYVTRGCIEQIGIMHEAYFLYFEELEWGIRARRAGLKIGYADTAVVIHEGGTTIGSATATRGPSKLATYLMFRNSVAFVAQLFPLWLPWHLAISMVHALRLLGVHRTKQAFAGIWAGIRGEQGRPDAWMRAHLG
jgi:GT2 family glycosyltransferase